MDKLLLDDHENVIQDKKGNYLFKDENGKEFYKPAPKEQIDDILAQAKKYREEQEQLKQKKVKNMAEENVTKFDVLKEKVEDFKEETKNKLSEREKIDKELEQKVKALDDKVCHGEDCYNRIEKQGLDNFKTLEERLKILEEPIYVCSNCGIGTMRRGQTECPYCHVKVKGWN